MLVPPKAPEALARDICRLFGDTDLRDRLGSEARRTIEGRFSWQVVGYRYLRRYRDLLSEAA
jgi:glycosyltransferase involved in cell wall biosynthesis